ncbi:hypothetical protein ACWCXH_24115 [Kitasatospora sp. NPDC001660]
MLARILDDDQAGQVDAELGGREQAEPFEAERGAPRAGGGGGRREGQEQGGAAAGHRDDGARAQAALGQEVLQDRYQRPGAGQLELGCQCGECCRAATSAP